MACRSASCAPLAVAAARVPPQCARRCCECSVGRFVLPGRSRWVRRRAVGSCCCLSAALLQVLRPPLRPRGQGEPWQRRDTRAQRARAALRRCNRAPGRDCRVPHAQQVGRSPYLAPFEELGVASRLHRSANPNRDGRRARAGLAGGRRAAEHTRGNLGVLRTGRAGGRKACSGV